MKRIEKWLREQIGLDAASVGSSSIERTMRLRMKDLGIRQVEDYFVRLEADPTEREELIESVVVTETWFFRDREPFTAFVQLVFDCLSRNPGQPLRVLSLPCSSGEEPYSLAMALLDAAVVPEQFVIEGVDLSLRALARAQRAVYGKNSFRGKPLDFRDRHFQATDHGYALHPRVRECVQFHRANLLEEKSLSGRGPYDFIFCRNLLIYFDRETQARALERLHYLLTPEGMLFVGPAELPLVTRHGFASVNVPMAFACRKATAAAPPPPAAHPIRAGVRPKHPPLPVSGDAVRNGGAPGEGGGNARPMALPATDVRPQTPAVMHPSPTFRSPSAEPPAPAAEPSVVIADLAAARELADGGRLEEAAAICEESIRRQGPSAQAYYLLGLVRDARRDSADPGQALDCYRKALYLDPNHYEALLQMALLLEKNGERAAARQFKRRAERVQSRPAA